MSHYLVSMRVEFTGVMVSHDLWKRVAQALPDGGQEIDHLALTQELRASTVMDLTLAVQVAEGVGAIGACMKGGALANSALHALVDEGVAVEPEIVELDVSKMTPPGCPGGALTSYVRSL